MSKMLYELRYNQYENEVKAYPLNIEKETEKQYRCSGRCIVRKEDIDKLDRLFDKMISETPDNPLFVNLIKARYEKKNIFLQSEIEKNCDIIKNLEEATFAVSDC